MGTLEATEIFGTAFEPLTKSRFIMYIAGIPAFLIKGAARPTISFEDIVLDHINIKRKVKGKGDWQDVTFTLYEPVVPSAAQAVMEWIRLSHESVTGREGYSDFYKKNITLNLLGPPGDKVQEWTYMGAYVKTATFGDLSWADNGFVDTSITIAYDYCILQY